MQEVFDFLKKCETYYLATVEGDQPRVRPFGTVNIFEGKLYIQTGRTKDVAKQIDREIRGIIGECHDKAREIILQHQDVLHRCAAILLEREKIHRDEFEALFSQTA